jgi:hypothetical protein
MENSINTLLNNSTYKILDLKNDINTFKNIIIKFCELNNILLFNKNLNISLIRNEKYNMDDLDNDFSFILFSNFPKKHATDLVNILFKEYSKYVFITSYLNNNEIVISIDNTKVIYFNLLFSLNIEYKTKIKPIKYNNIYLLSNDIILLFLTHELYNPTIFIKLINDNTLMTYKNTIYEEKPINKLTNIEKYYILLKKTFPYNKSTDNNIEIINKSYTQGLKNKILFNFFKIILTLDISKSMTLLDIHAINILSSNDLLPSAYNDTLNFIIQNNSNSNKFNIIQYILDIIKDILKQQKIKYKNIAYKKSNLYLYNDFRLKKTNIYLISDDNKKISLINLFNSTDYELIPIIKKYQNLNIPHEFVIIRFMLINLIEIKLYDPYFNDSIYNKYISNISKLYTLNIEYTKIFYIGLYKDEKIDKFKLGANTIRPLQLELKNKSNIV